MSGGSQNEEMQHVPADQARHRVLRELPQLQEMHQREKEARW